jgi:hypothetical protein
VPPRSNWNNAPQAPVAGYDPAPVELGTDASHVGGYSSQPRRPRVNSGGSDVYFEDVDPRFANEPQPTLPNIPPEHEVQKHSTAPPPLLMPGHPDPNQYRPESYGEIPQTNSYEDLPGARSPAESETSNFTSVSQRGVNPNWRPGNGGEFNSLPPRRRDNASMRHDVLLQGNPDFELPGAMAPMRNRGPPGMRGSNRGPPQRISPASAVGTGVDGPYPSPVPPHGPLGGIREI